MIRSISKQIIGAFSEPIILSVLQQGDSYGYKIIQLIKEISNKEITWNEASIYPVLKKLEIKGLIKSYWKQGENERPRKYYSILSDGVKQLEFNMYEWNTIQKLFEKLNTFI